MLAGAAVWATGGAISRGWAMSRFVATIDTRQAAATLERTSTMLPSRMARSRRFVAGYAAPVYRSVAPRRTGRLQRGIRVEEAEGRSRVSVQARSQAGFDYVGVTRFGHRQRIIRPRTARVLRFEVGGRVFFRPWVRGYRPAVDWVQRGHERLRPVLEREARRLAQEIAT